MAKCYPLDVNLWPFNMLFDFIYGLRKSRQNLKQMLLMGASLTAVTLIFVVIMALGEHILRDRPEWVDDDISLLTLGKISENGALMPVSKSDLEMVKHYDTINHAASISLYQQVLEDKQSNQSMPVTLVFFDDNMQVLFKDEVNKVFQSGKTGHHVWVTNDFWQKHQHKLPDIGQTVYLGAENKGFILAGVLDREFDIVGGESADFWLHEASFASLFEMKIAASNGIDDSTFRQILQQAKKQAIAKIEIRYLLLEPKVNFNQEAFLQRLLDDAKTNHNSDFITLGGGTEYQLLKGVEFAPQVKDKLVNQWWVLLFFALGLSLITFINVVTFVSSQLVLRQQELNIRIIYGSSLKALLKQFALEALPMFLSTLILSITMLILVYQFAGTSKQLISVLGTSLPSPSLLALFISFLTLTIFAFSAFLFPCVSAYKSSLFSRQQGSGETKQQALLQRVISSVQVTVAAVSIFMTSQYLHQQWKQKDLHGFDKEVIEYQLTTSNMDLVTKARVKQVLVEYPNTAFAAASFVDPEAIYQEVKISSHRKMTTKRVQHMEVSENYFSVLQAEYYHYGRIDEQSVVLNQAALSLFNLDLLQPLLSYRVTIDERTYKVAGIIKNLPHFGQHNKHVPIIYKLFNGETPSLSGFVLNRSHSTPLKEHEQLVKLGKLEHLLHQFDSKRLWFIYLSLGLLIFLFVVTLVALYVHSVARMKKLDQRFGTFLSLGISDRALFIQCAKLFYVPLFTAALSLLITFYVRAYNGNGVYESMLYTMSSSILILVVIAAFVYVHYTYLTKRPISDLLRSR